MNEPAAGCPNSDRTIEASIGDDVKDADMSASGNTGPEDNSGDIFRHSYRDLLKELQQVFDGHDTAENRGLDNNPAETDPAGTASSEGFTMDSQQESQETADAPHASLPSDPSGTGETVVQPDAENNSELPNGGRQVQEDTVPTAGTESCEGSPPAHTLPDASTGERDVIHHEDEPVEIAEEDHFSEEHFAEGLDVDADNMTSPFQHTGGPTSLLDHTQQDHANDERQQPSPGSGADLKDQGARDREVGGGGTSIRQSDAQESAHAQPLHRGGPDLSHASQSASISWSKAPRRLFRLVFLFLVVIAFGLFLWRLLASDGRIVNFVTRNIDIPGQWRTESLATQPDFPAANPSAPRRPEQWTMTAVLGDLAEPGDDKLVTGTLASLAIQAKEPDHLPAAPSEGRESANSMSGRFETLPDADKSRQLWTELMSDGDDRLASALENLEQAESRLPANGQDSAIGQHQLPDGKGQDKQRVHAADGDLAFPEFAGNANTAQHSRSRINDQEALAPLDAINAPLSIRAAANIVEDSGTSDSTAAAAEQSGALRDLLVQVESLTDRADYTEVLLNSILAAVQKESRPALAFASTPETHADIIGLTNGFSLDTRPISDQSSSNETLYPADIGDLTWDTPEPGMPPELADRGVATSGDSVGLLKDANGEPAGEREPLMFTVQENSSGLDTLLLSSVGPDDLVHGFGEVLEVRVDAHGRLVIMEHGAVLVE